MIFVLLLYCFALIVLIAIGASGPMLGVGIAGYFGMLAAWSAGAFR